MNGFAFGEFFLMEKFYGSADPATPAASAYTEIKIKSMEVLN